MLQDETCYFLAADLMAKVGRTDAGAFLETCVRLSVPAYWNGRDPAMGRSLAVLRGSNLGESRTKLGSHVLTETMERRPEIARSYDRLFPNQDTLPKADLEPDCAAFAKEARERITRCSWTANSFSCDQWSFLPSVRKISRAQAEAHVRDAESRGK